MVSLFVHIRFCFDLFGGLPLFFFYFSSLLRAHIYDCVFACVRASMHAEFYMRVRGNGGSQRSPIILMLTLIFMLILLSYLDCHCDFSDQVIKSIRLLLSSNRTEQKKERKKEETAKMSEKKRIHYM